MNIFITRHCLSCNNINSGKLYSLFKDFEPNLSNKGVEDCFTLSKNFEELSVDTLYVSPLIRTWESAIILYQNSLRKELNLIISPYLKEHIKSHFKRGNYPKDINRSIRKFIFFLNEISKWIKEDNLNNNLPEKINILIPNFINNDCNMDIIKDWKEIKIIKNINDIYELENENIIKDSILNNSVSEYYLKDGDIELFLDWINNTDHKKKKNIHVICHSNVMKSFSKAMNYNIKHVEKHNAWTLHITLNNDNNGLFVELNEILEGIKKNVKLAKTKEKIRSVCGKKGSIDYSVKGSKRKKKSKRKTKRNKKRYTKRK